MNAGERPDGGCVLGEMLAEMVEAVEGLAVSGRAARAALDGHDGLEGSERQEVAAALLCAGNLAAQMSRRLEEARAIVRDADREEMGRVSGALDDLRQRWAEEAAERGEMDRARGLEAVASDEQPVDRDAVLEQLHAEDDEDQPLPWRRSA